MGAKESKEQAVRQGSYIARNKHHRNQILVIAKTDDTVRFQYGTHPQVIIMKDGKRLPFSGMINDLDFFLFTIFHVIETYVWQGPPGRISRNSSRDSLEARITPRSSLSGSGVGVSFASNSAPASPKDSPKASPKGSPRQSPGPEIGARIPKQNSSDSSLGKGNPYTQSPRQELLARQKSMEFQRLVSKTDLTKSDSPRNAETAVTFSASPRLVKVSSQADLLRELRPKGSKVLEERIAIREYINNSNYMSPLRDEIIGVAKRIVCDMLITGDIDTAIMNISTYAHGLGSDGMSHEILALFNFRSFDPAQMDCLFTESMSKVAYPSIKLFYHMGLYLPYFALAPILGMRMHLREMNHLLDLVPDLILKTYDGEKLILEAILDPVNGILPKEQVPDFPITKFLPGPNNSMVTPLVRERVSVLLGLYGILDSDTKSGKLEKGDPSLRLDKKVRVCDTIRLLKTWLECTRSG